MKVYCNDQTPIPIKMWLDDIEESALGQAVNLSQLPFAFSHIALMPGCHPGYGMPIESVLATRDVVIPNAAGVDIGCGVAAVRTDLTEIDTAALKAAMGKIRETVPVGFKHHDKPQKQDDSLKQEWEYMPVVEQEYKASLCQRGTLGGGNHFIEIQKGSDGFIWVMVHSGSRNLGYKVANHYNELAVELNAKWFSAVPPQHQLAFLPLDSPEGKDYLEEMRYCVNFAELNRRLIIEKVLDALGVGVMDFMDVAHNYAVMEHHFGQNVMVHRKGATRARSGEAGIIPGSQGTKSYIVEGLGSADSFMSCSHGAGRRMGRKQAQRELDLEAEQKRLDDQGILHSVRGLKDLDEAAGAYKDIQVVMSNQADLVDVVVELTPLAVVKG